MERSNQPPKTECCREEGQVPKATEVSGPNDLLEAYTGQLTGRKQDSHPAKAIQPRPTAPVWRTLPAAERTEPAELFLPIAESSSSRSGRSDLPKGEGKWRPLGIPALEDKLVQLAVAQILNAIYEADF